MPPSIPEIIAALAFFGLMVICPLVYMLMKHQRAMAEIIHGKGANDSTQRIEALEREVRELRSALHDRIIRDDDQKELGRRINELER